MIGVGLFVGGVPVRQVYVGSTPVREVYVGSGKIWPTTEAVRIILGTGNEARDQLRAALSDRGLGYQTVEELPFDIELVGSGSVQSMFNGCSSLTHAPDMDTSRVTNMNQMFSGCAALTSVPDMDTSLVTNMYFMFQGCVALTHAPAMDTSSVTNMSFMFYGCAELTDGNVRLIGRHPNVTTSNMINGSGLTREPFYDADGNPI